MFSTTSRSNHRIHRLETAGGFCLYMPDHRCDRVKHNSHDISILGDKLINPIVGVYRAPLKGFLLKVGGLPSPRNATFDHGHIEKISHKKTHSIYPTHGIFMQVICRIFELPSSHGLSRLFLNHDLRPDCIPTHFLGVFVSPDAQCMVVFTYIYHLN